VQTFQISFRERHKQENLRAGKAASVTRTYTTWRLSHTAQDFSYAYTSKWNTNVVHFWAFTRRQNTKSKGDIQEVSLVMAIQSW